MLIETIKSLPIDDRIIVLCDLANINHKYPIGESLNAYRNLRKIFEGYDFMNLSMHKRKLFAICEDNLFKLRSKMGHAAMMSLNESDDIEQEKIQKKNKEEFEKKADERRKSEEEPLAKTLRSKGDNQDDAADELNVHKSTISRWKTGTRNPSFENLKDLKSVYGSGIVSQILSRE